MLEQLINEVDKLYSTKIYMELWACGNENPPTKPMFSLRLLDSFLPHE